MQKKNSKRSDDWHSSAKVEKSLLVMSLKYTPVKHIVLDLSNMRKNHTSLNYTGQESKKMHSKKQFDTSVTFKQGQGHQTWCALAHSKQGYANAKFEKPRLNSVREKPNEFLFFIFL